MHIFFSKKTQKNAGMYSFNVSSTLEIVRLGLNINRMNVSYIDSFLAGN